MSPVLRQHLPRFCALLLPTASGDISSLLLGPPFSLPPLWAPFVALVQEKRGWRTVSIWGL